MQEFFEELTLKNELVALLLEFESMLDLKVSTIF